MSKLLKDTHPEVAAEWDRIKNEASELSLEKITYGSSKKAWWICSICGHSYQALPCNRTRNPKPSGCPECGKKSNAQSKSKPLRINGEDYSSLELASATLGLNRDTVRKRIAHQVQSPDGYVLEIPSKNNRKYGKREDRVEHGSLAHMRGIAEECGFFKFDDWLTKPREGVLPTQYAQIVKQSWGGDWIGLFKALYPGQDVHFWKMNRMPPRIWDKKENIEAYMSWLEDQLNIQTIDDWYDITAGEVRSNYGAKLLRKFDEKLSKLLQFYLPDVKWLLWRFKKMESGFWTDTEVQKAFLNYLADSLGYEKPTDWYEVTLADFKKHGGATLVRHYETMVDCITSLYPEYDLLPWKFTRAGRGFWDQNSNQRRFLLWAADQLGFVEPRDFTNLTETNIEDLGGVSLLVKYDHSIAKAVLSLFPEWNLSVEDFDYSSKSQRRLFKFLKYCLPNTKMLYEHKHDELRFIETGRKMESDIYFPDYKVTIEIQGEQHYRPAWGGQEEFENIRRRDVEKHQAMRDSGIRLIEMKQIEIPSYAVDLIEYSVSAFNDAEVPELAELLQLAEDLAFSWVDPDAL